MNNLFSIKKSVLFILSLSFLVASSCEQTPKAINNKTTTPPAILTHLDSNSGEGQKNNIDLDEEIVLGKELNQDNIQAGDLDRDDPTTDYIAKKSNYNLEKPSLVCNLPEELIEVSALGYDEASRKLVTVNDEKANFYTLDMKDCRLETKYDFGKKGDYEGIERIGNITYVAKSNGDIYLINNDPELKAVIYNTPLSSDNDVEGLGFDKARNELILACKGNPNIDKKPKLKKSKAFYAFSLNTKQLDKKPKFIIKDKDLGDYFDKMPKKGLSKKGKKKLEKRLKDFSPSGIAKHPIDGFYYILSSTGRLLIVSDGKGEIKDIHFLKPSMFAQPEGICFAPNGKMYISNEGRSLVAKILVFDYEK